MIRFTFSRPTDQKRPWWTCQCCPDRSLARGLRLNSLEASLRRHPGSIPLVIPDKGAICFDCDSLAAVKAIRDELDSGAIDYLELSSSPGKAHFWVRIPHTRSWQVSGLPADVDFRHAENGVVRLTSLTAAEFVARLDKLKVSSLARLPGSYARKKSAATRVTKKPPTPVAERDVLKVWKGKYKQLHGTAKDHALMATFYHLAASIIGPDVDRIRELVKQSGIPKAKRSSKKWLTTDIERVLAARAERMKHLGLPEKRETFTSRYEGVKMSMTARRAILAIDAHIDMHNIPAQPNGDVIDFGLSIDQLHEWAGWSTRKSAQDAFPELYRLGFLTLTKEYIFNPENRAANKTREWTLNAVPVERDKDDCLNAAAAALTGGMCPRLRARTPGAAATLENSTASIETLRAGNYAIDEPADLTFDAATESWVPVDAA